ncbi:MAG: hydroxyisourate hydrolase, partial [Pseudomonadota bacterium]
VERPLLEGDHFYKGQFKLCFHVGDYYKTTDLKLSEPAFLDIVPVAFGISDEQAHYHVPLLISPYGYSTYRGS